MDSSFLNLEIRRCSGKNIDRCEMVTPMFSRGIYMCEKHGDIRISPFHTSLIRNNKYLKSKHLCNIFFKSEEYNDMLNHKRFKKKVREIMYNITSLNVDVLREINKFI